MVHTFPRDICPKANVTKRLEFKLDNFETSIQHFRYYVMGSLSWDFEIKTNPPIQVRRPSLDLINKKRTGNLVDFAVSADHRVTMKKIEKLDKYLDLARKVKKLWKMKIIVRSLELSPRTREIDWMNWEWEEELNHPNNSTIKIDLNTRKSPWDQRRFAAIQTSMKNWSKN